MSMLLNRINSTGNVQLSLDDNGSLKITSDKPLSKKQLKWLREHEADIQKELVAIQIHNAAYPDGFGALIMQQSNLWDFMDSFADMAYANGGQWQQAFNVLVWWLSLCVDDKSMTLNQLRVELGLMPRFFLNEHVIDERIWFADLTKNLSHSQLREVSKLYNRIFDDVFDNNEHVPIKRENLARRAANAAIVEHISRGQNHRKIAIVDIRTILKRK